MIKECKKCGSKNLYLEPRIKGQDVLNANMVALKCKDCGFWLKWCPKEDRQYYLNKQPKDKWKKLKERVNKKFNEEENCKVAIAYRKVLTYMRELEGEDEHK